MCVIPRPENNWRPLALRHGPLAFLSALMIIANLTAIGAVALTPRTAELSTITSAHIIQLTNAERVAAGQQKLTVSSQLTQAAQQKGEHMLAEDYFAHISPSGVTPWFWMNKVGYSYQVAGENLAIDFVEAEDVVAAWLASPSHKENMLLPQYTETGVAVVTGEFQGSSSTIVVHMFGRPSVAAATTAIPPAQSTPKPTPIPSETPTPLPTTPPDTTPPRTPRIALDGSTTTVQDTVSLSIAGEAKSQAHVLVNNQARGVAPLDADGNATFNLNIKDIPDGAITIRAYATDAADNKSGLSEPVLLAKDTTGPLLAREAVSYVLSPMTDSPQWLVTIRAEDISTIAVARGSEKYSFAGGTRFVLPVSAAPLTLTATDAAGNTSAPYEVTLQPQFTTDNDVTAQTPPAQFNRLTRRLTATVFLVVLILLSLAVLIKIRIQHPTLIGHAALVLLLAASLLLW